MKKIGLILILIVMIIQTFASFVHATEEDQYTEIAQIFVRPHMFLCQFDYPKVIDNKCGISHPVSAAGEWCQCSFNGVLVNGYTITNPSHSRWQPQ